MNIRQFHEEREQRQYASWACLSTNTKGRQTPEEKCPIRTDFQRDRDRILYSKAFRRLVHKTQVFIAPEGDHFRTRLTHTLDVSQISRSIARALRLNEDLAEAIALGHDLGHAPFGHCGERVLNELMEKYLPGSHFRHNEQSLRVVDFLEGKNGLNLTWEVRDGILKHSKGNTDIHQSSEKSMPQTAEGAIVRISDRLAYISHDIDDAVRAGIITIEDLPEHARIRVGVTVSERIGAMITDIIKTSQSEQKITMSEEMEKIVDDLKNFMFERVYKNPIAKAEDKKARLLIISMFEYFLNTPGTLPKSEKNREEPMPRQICDYIAGMSDRYAIGTYNKIFIPRMWDIQ